MPGRRQRFSGIPVSAGVAIGPVFRASEPTPEITRHKIQAADCAAEGARLDAAIAQSRKQLTKLRASAGRAARGEPGGIGAADRGLHPHAGLVAPDPRRATADRGDAAVGRERRRGGGGGDRRGDPGAGRTRHAGGGPRRPDAPRRGGARDRPATGAQPDPVAVPQLRRPARGRGADQRVAAAVGRGAARPVAPRRRGDRGGRRGGPHRGHAAGAGRAGGARRGGPRACDPAGRHGGGGRFGRHRGAEPAAARRSPRRGGRSPPSPASGSASPGCAACPRRRWTARRWSCRPTWNCRSNCR